MGRIGFEAPDTVQELLAVLNRSGKWVLTLVDSKGRVTGHYQETQGRAQELNVGGGAVVYQGEVDGDGRILFAGDTDEGAIEFLYGCFLGTFGGRSLESIQDETTHRPEQFV